MLQIFFSSFDGVPLSQVTGDGDDCTRQASTCSRSMELALKLLQLVLTKLPSYLLVSRYQSEISNLVPAIARQFAVLHSALKFDVVHLLATIMSSKDTRRNLERGGLGKVFNGLESFMSQARHPHLRDSEHGQKASIAKLFEQDIFSKMAIKFQKILSFLESEDADVRIHAVKVVANLAAEGMSCRIGSTVHIPWEGRANQVICCVLLDNTT